MKPWFAIALCVCFIAASLESVHGGLRAAPPKDVLVIGTGGDIGSLDLARGFRMPPSTILAPIYETLVKTQISPEGGETYVSGVAASWESNETSTEWVFHLKQNHYFDDGTELTAESVKFTFDRILGLGLGPSTAFSFLAGTDVIDKFTVRFRLHNPNPLFLPLLSDLVTGLINPKVMQHAKGGDYASQWLGEHPAGSGPYRLTRAQAGKFYSLERNPYYSGQTGPINRVIIKVVPDETVRALQLRKGDLDVALQLSGEALGNIEENPNVVVHAGPANAYLFFVLNTKQGPMANPAIRKALNFAVDYKSAVDIVMNGRASYMRGPIPKGMLGAVPELYPLDFDLDKARATLADASVDMSKSIRIALPQTSSSDTETLALMLQANLVQLGFEATIEHLTLVTMIDRLDRAEFDIALMGWFAVAGDPSALVNFWMDPQKAGSGGNFAHYMNEEVAALLEQSVLVQDKQKRDAIVRKALTLAHKDNPYVFIAQKHSWAVMHKRIGGFHFSPKEYLTVHPETLFKKH